MAKNVYVGNMNYDTNEEKLRQLFEAHGEIATINIIMDRYSGRPKGFAFVEMATEEGAKAAIAALDGQEVDGRTLKVAEARPRRPRSGGDRGGYGGSGGRRDW